MTQINHPPASGVFMTWWSRLAGIPGGKKMFSLLLGRMAPYTGTIGARVEELEAGRARVCLRERRGLRNHLNSLHAIALINLGELATGLAVLSTLTADMRGIVLKIEAEYLKKARGNITAVASFTLPVDLDDDTPCEVEAELLDEAGDIVSRVKATWLLGYKTT